MRPLYKVLHHPKAQHILSHYRAIYERAVLSECYYHLFLHPLLYRFLISSLFRMQEVQIPKPQALPFRLNQFRFLSATSLYRLHYHFLLKIACPVRVFACVELLLLCYLSTASHFLSFHPCYPLISRCLQVLRLSVSLAHAKRLLQTAFVCPKTLVSGLLPVLQSNNLSALQTASRQRKSQ